MNDCVGWKNEPASREGVRGGDRIKPSTPQLWSSRAA